jgi:hypothetical protein
VPAPAAEPHHATQVTTLLHREGAKHLRTRKHGVALIVESGPAGDPTKHFRLRRDTVHLWRLDMATHTGRWEPTPFRGQLGELVAMVVESFPWTIAPIA